MLTRHLAAPLALLAAAAGLQAQVCNQPKILWMGNSLGYGIASFIEDLAEHQGLPTTAISDQLQGGQWLRNLAPDTTLLNSYINSGAPGESWDYAIIQGYSTEPTVTRGDPQRFANNALTIAQAVRAHSPHAVILLYQTYAYGPGHSYYPTWYPSPADMQADVRAGYELAYNTIEAALGPGSVRIMPVGDAYEAAGFDPSLYQQDQIHGDWTGRILSSLAMYRTMYRAEIGSIPVQISNLSSDFERRVDSFGVDQSMYVGYRNIADSVGYPYYGSAFDVIAAARVNGSHWTSRAVQEVAPGDTFEMWFQSPQGTYASSFGVLLLAPFDTGIPLPSIGIAELHLPPGPATTVQALAPLTAGGAYWNLTIPSWFQTGVSFMVQYANFDPAPCSGNSFTTGDAIEGQIK